MSMPLRKLSALSFSSLPAVILMTLSAAATAGEPLALGASAPMADAKLKDAATGKDVSIAGVKGSKGTLVVFTCNGCPFAKAWEERIVTLGNTYGKKGIGVLLVNANDPGKGANETSEAMAARAKERQMAFPYAVDATSAVAKAFGATKTPEAFVFDKAGKLVYRGTVDDNHEDTAAVKQHFLKDALDAVVAGKAPAPAETKSVGCGIKFRKVS